MLPYKSRIEDFRGYTKLLQFPQLILANATILMRMQLRNAICIVCEEKKGNDIVDTT